MSKAVSKARFKQVYEETRNIAFPFPGTPDQAWEVVQDGSILFRKMISSLPPEERKMAGIEISKAWNKYYDGHQTTFTSPVVLALGVK